MKILTARWQNFVIDLDGAAFTVTPLTMADRFACQRVLGEIAAVGAANVHLLSTEARADVRDLLMTHIIGWEGVTDDRGPVAFDATLIDRFFDVGTALVLFFRIYQAATPTEEERKNLSTASRSAESAPATSIAAAVDNTAPTLAANPVS